jgi:type II secretory pathway component PulK
MWKQLKLFCANFWTRDVRTRHMQAILDSMALTGRFNINSLKTHQELSERSIPASRSAGIL